MQVVFSGLVILCLLGAGVGSITAPLVFPETPSTPAVQVSPTPTLVEPTDVNVTATDANITADDDNSTMAVLQITDYHYFDWPKIGYKVFMQKMVDALETLKFFMGLDPMILKITRTFILTNDTDLDYDDNNNSTDINSNEISSTQANQSIETNTESPLSAEISGKNSEEAEGENKSSLKGNNDEQQKDDDVKKTKTESSGFFGSIASAVSSFYHTLTGWF